MRGKVIMTQQMKCLRTQAINYNMHPFFAQQKSNSHFCDAASPIINFLEQYWRSIRELEIIIKSIVMFYINYQ